MTTSGAGGAGMKRSGLPAGRDEVVAAILAAAAELFAEHGPAATSIRDIAAKSKVNHGLVFRHFGAKENLIGAVLDHTSAKLTTLIDGDGPPEQIEGAIDRQWRVLARTLLDGYPAEQLQTRFPIIARLLDAAESQHANYDDAHTAVANVVALQLGWRLFEPFLRTAAEIEDLPEAQLQAAIRTETTRMLRPYGEPELQPFP